MTECDCVKPNCDCGCMHAAEKSNCDRTQSKIEELLRDELCQEESRPIREHLAECAECQEEQRVCEALTDAVQRGCKEKAPAHLRDAILDALSYS